MRNWFICALFLCLAQLGAADSASAQQLSANETAYGYAAQRPVIGGACPTCPWGAVATIVRTLMAPTGWDIQQCYSCLAADSVRIVAQARRPPDFGDYSRLELPPSPDAPVDFGVTNIRILSAAYAGRDAYSRDGPYPHLRAVARIELPTYLIVATRAEAMITDLAQIRRNRLPVRIISDDRPATQIILDHYGITEEALHSWGGEFADREGRDRFDVIIYSGYLGNSPESDIWYETSQRNNLRFLELPETLLARLDNEFDYFERVSLPLGYLRGVDRPIRTVGQSGIVVYGRDDMPDDFVYTLARTLDDNRRAFMWSHLSFHYDPATVWQAAGVPLHPGAERYYRERGYMR